MNPRLISNIEKIQNGQISRNRCFDLFRRREIVMARKAHARIFGIKKRLESGNWELKVTGQAQDNVELELSSSVFAARWITRLSSPEWQYLRDLLQDT